MRKKNSQARLQPIGEILSSAFRKRGLGGKLEENAILKLWPKAVGAQIARQTEPECLRSGTLFVKTTSSVWVQQLHFMKDDIRNKLNDLGGKASVKEIHFTVGLSPSRANAGRDMDSEKIVLRDRDVQMISDCTRTLTDPELASVVKRVMRAEISRRRLLEKKQGR